MIIITIKIIVVILFSVDYITEMPHTPASNHHTLISQTKYFFDINLP